MLKLEFCVVLSSDIARPRSAIKEVDLPAWGVIRSVFARASVVTMLAVSSMSLKKSLVLLLPLLLQRVVVVVGGVILDDPEDLLALLEDPLEVSRLLEEDEDEELGCAFSSGETENEHDLSKVLLVGVT